MTQRRHRLAFYISEAPARIAVEFLKIRDQRFDKHSLEVFVLPVFRHVEIDSLVDNFCLVKTVDYLLGLATDLEFGGEVLSFDEFVFFLEFFEYAALAGASACGVYASPDEFEGPFAEESREVSGCACGVVGSCEGHRGGLYEIYR